MSYYKSHISIKGDYIHIRRGLRSCLSIRGGKFEGLDCEISNEYGSHAFLFYVATDKRSKYSCRRSQEIKKKWLVKVLDFLFTLNDTVIHRWL